MPKTYTSLEVNATFSADGNPFTVDHVFHNLPSLALDASAQLMEKEGATLDTLGDLVWQWSAKQDVPLSIPLNLPLGIHETLRELLKLAESVTVTLS